MGSCVGTVLPARVVAGCMPRPCTAFFSRSTGGPPGRIQCEVVDSPRCASPNDGRRTERRGQPLVARLARVENRLWTSCARWADEGRLVARPRTQAVWHVFLQPGGCLGLSMWPSHVGQAPSSSVWRCCGGLGLGGRADYRHKDETQRELSSLCHGIPAASRRSHDPFLCTCARSMFHSHRRGREHFTRGERALQSRNLAVAVSSQVRFHVHARSNGHVSPLSPTSGIRRSAATVSSPHRRNESSLLAPLPGSPFATRLAPPRPYCLEMCIQCPCIEKVQACGVSSRFHDR